MRVDADGKAGTEKAPTCGTASTGTGGSSRMAVQASRVFTCAIRIRTSAAGRSKALIGTARFFIARRNRGVGRASLSRAASTGTNGAGAGTGLVVCVSISRGTEARAIGGASATNATTLPMIHPPTTKARKRIGGVTPRARFAEKRAWSCPIALRPCGRLANSWQAHAAPPASPRNWRPGRGVSRADPRRCRRQR